MVQFRPGGKIHFVGSKYSVSLTYCNIRVHPRQITERVHLVTCKSCLIRLETDTRLARQRIRRIIRDNRS